jgi:hypothetical protein
MRSVLTRILVLLLPASLACAPAFAQPQQESSAPKPDVHVFNYGQLNQSCQQWSDGCRVCTREGCSNISTACQPTEVKCMAPADAQEKDH